jgi:two-component sensor histidine kinase
VNRRPIIAAVFGGPESEGSGAGTRPFGGFVERKPGLGLRLVSELTKDIDGVVEMVSNPGTTVSIRFTPRPILIQVKEVE